MRVTIRHLLRFIGVVLLGLVLLQLVFAARIAVMRVLDPASTSFQRSEAWRLLVTQQRLPWRQAWVPYERIAPSLKRAVIASEDANFADHSGVEWEAIERAWERNLQAETRAARLEHQIAKNGRRMAARPAEVRIVGGSTITQQLAKNLFLSGERRWPRKAEELAITYMLEALLDKQRILELYLNHVEWGEGVFGAEAAAQRYFRSSAGQLGPAQAAQLAVMLPAPKRFEKRPSSAYVLGRAGTIAARMGDVQLP